MTHACSGARRDGPGSSGFYPFSLEVQEFIRITVQPESQVVTEGTRVSLSCQASGPPGLSYQWFCGKHEVRSQSRRRLRAEGSTAPWKGSMAGSWT